MCDSKNGKADRRGQHPGSANKSQHSDFRGFGVESNAMRDPLCGRISDPRDIAWTEAARHRVLAELNRLEPQP